MIVLSNTWGALGRVVTTEPSATVDAGATEVPNPYSMPMVPDATSYTQFCGTVMRARHMPVLSFIVHWPLAVAAPKVARA